MGIGESLPCVDLVIAESREAALYVMAMTGGQIGLILRPEPSVSLP